MNLGDFPKDKVLPMIEGWGGMTVDINKAPAGTDFGPLLEGLKNNGLFNNSISKLEQ